MVTVNPTNIPIISVKPLQKQYPDRMRSSVATISIFSLFWPSFHHSPPRYSVRYRRSSHVGCAPPLSFRLSGELGTKKHICHIQRLETSLSWEVNPSCLHWICIFWDDFLIFRHSHSLFTTVIVRQHNGRFHPALGNICPWCQWVCMGQNPGTRVPQVIADS